MGCRSGAKGGLTVIRYFACHQLSPALLNGHEAFVASLEMCMVGSGSAAFGAVVKDCIISQLLCQIQHIAETGGICVDSHAPFPVSSNDGEI